MFCKNCGTEISEQTKFCPKCGNAVMNNKESQISKKEDNLLRLSFKPKFNLLYKILTIIGTGAIFFLVVVFPFIGQYGETMSEINQTAGYEVYSKGNSAGVVMLIVFILYLFISLIVSKMQYDNIRYDFYGNRVEYIDGFLNRERKELKYKYVREVTMSQNVLERLCGIGTIKISTNAFSGSNSTRSHNSMRGMNGIFIHCVEDVEEQYKIIKQIIDEGTPED